MNNCESRKVYCIEICKNVNVRAVFDCLLTKSVEISLSVVNDNVNNVYLMTSLIYVKLHIVANFITQFFLSHWCAWYKRPTEIIEMLRGCNKKAVIKWRCVSRSYWQWIAILAIPVPI